MLQSDIGLDWSSYLVMGLYLVAMIGLGSWFGRGKVDTETYLLGGRCMPWWVVGISYLVSVFSTVSLVSGPGEAYEHGATLGLATIITPIASIFAFLIFVRFYFKHRIFTPFDYLERRFDARVRGIVAAMFCLTRLTYLAMVLYASAKILQGAAGWPIWITIIAVGMIGVVYTVMGGIRAVIWTDLIQFVVLVGGLAWITVVLCEQVPGGAQGVISTAQAHDHLFPDLNTAEFYTFDPRVRLTLGFILIIYICEALMYNSGDQIALQRLLSTSSYEAAWKSLLTYAGVLLPFLSVFWFVGIGVYSFYMHQPEAVRPERGDLALFNFIATELPHPVPGLILSAMLAAAMSTLDSGMNSLATVMTKDFYLRFLRPEATEERQVAISRWLTFLIGGGAIIASLAIYVVSEWAEDTIMEAMMIWGSFSALIAPIFLLGVTSRRLRARHVLVSLGIGTIVLLGLLTWRMLRGDELSFIVVTPFTLLVTVAVGYAMTPFVKPLPREETRDLTY